MNLRISKRQIMTAAFVAIFMASSVGQNVVPAGGELQPFFRIYLLYPTDVPLSAGIVAIYANQLEELNIKVIRIGTTKSEISTREFRPTEENIGKPYEDGGYDIGRLDSWQYGPSPDLMVWLSENAPPVGSNYGLWNFSESDEIIRDYLVELDTDKRIELAIAWQEWFREWLPEIDIYYPNAIYGLGERFDPNSFGTPIQNYVNPQVWRWKVADPEKPVTFQRDRDPNNFNPLYYAPLMGTNGLVQVATESLAIIEDWDDRVFVPWLAKDWSSTDGKKWIINLRDDVEWQDGVKFNATDVKFTFDTILNPDAACYEYGKVESLIGSSDNIKITGEYQVTMDLPEPGPFLPSIVLPQGIVPWHVLKDVPATELLSHPYSTGVGSYTVDLSDHGLPDYTANGPIGTGSYIFDEWDPTLRTAKFHRNLDWWGWGVVEGTGNVERYYFTVITNAESAVTALKAGDIDVLGMMYGIEEAAESVLPPWGTVIEFSSPMWNRMCINLRHPVFGTGVDTPLGKKEPTRASEAAKYVRHALSHAMPRQQIIDQLLHGRAQAASVAMPMGCPEWDTNNVPDEFSIETAKDYLELAGYSYETPAQLTPSFMEQYGIYVGSVIGLFIGGAASSIYWRRKLPIARSAKGT